MWDTLRESEPLFLCSYRRKIRRVFAAAVLALSAQSVEAAASDVEMLARVLIPAYMAEDFAGLCRTDDPTYLTGEIDSFPSLREYAQHIDREVTAGISERDAATVRFTAAGVALQIARDELGNLNDASGVRSKARIHAWCEGSAKEFILYLVSTHQRQHALFDRIVETAKDR